jgi:hypothetical protein
MGGTLVPGVQAAIRPSGVPARYIDGCVSEPAGHLQCPFCSAYEVERLYLATLRLDSCECLSCGARWDEEAGTGTYRGRASRA